MRAVVRSIEHVSHACGAVGALLVLVLMALMVYEVAMRYVFSAPTIWSYDLSTMTMGAMFLLGIGYALLTDSHVRVDLLHTVLGRRARPVVDLCGHALFMLPLLVWVSWQLGDYFYEGFRSGERTGASAWNPLVWPFRAIMLAGVVVWSLQTLAEVLKAALVLLGPSPDGKPPTGR